MAETREALQQNFYRLESEEEIDSRPIDSMQEVLATRLRYVKGHTLKNSGVQFFRNRAPTKTKTEMSKLKKPDRLFQ